MRTFGIATLWEGGRWVPHSVRHWKTLLELLYERFADRFRSYWVLSLQVIPVPFGVLPRTVILNWSWKQPVIRAWRVQYFPEVRATTKKVFGWAIMDWFLYFFDIHKMYVVFFVKESLKYIVFIIGILLFDDLRLFALTLHFLLVHINILQL